MIPEVDCKRVFLGWNDPFLDSACKWLLSQAKTDSHLDLSHLNILSTVGRASRHLNEKLLFGAERKNLGYSPPNFISVSGLFNSLLPSHKIIEPLDSKLVFFSLLKNTDQQIVQGLFPSLKEYSDSKLFEKAEFLASTYQEFTKNGDDACASIAKLLNSGMISEETRWLMLTNIFELYKNSLKKLNLSDTQSCLTELEDSPRTQDSKIVLLACYDLTPIIKRAILSGFAKVTSLIFAPSKHQNGFDEIGCIKSEYWLSQNSKIDPKQIDVCSSSEQQVNKIFLDLSEISNPVAANEITIGALEPGMGRLIELAGSQRELPIHLPNNASIQKTEPAQLVIKALKYNLTKKFSDLAELLCITSFAETLPLGCKTLELVNNYREESLQPLVVAKLPDCSFDFSNSIKAINQSVKTIDLKNASLRSWVTACCSFLTSIYTNNRSSELEVVLDVLQSLLLTHSVEELPDKIIYQLIQDSLGELSTSIDTHESQFGNLNSIDVVGWLELALDDAPYTFICSFNEGYAPASSTVNAFLPNKARKLLALEDNDYRLARDSYILETFLSSKRYFKIYSARKSLEGSPLLPSRLILRGQAQNAAENVEHFFSSNFEEASDKFETAKKSFKETYAQALLPKNIQQSSPLSISVTAIKDYLECPYLYYLKHVLKLEPANPTSRELSALQFGSLLHDLVARFANSALAKESSQESIESNLLCQLEIIFYKTFGQNPFPEVLVQYHQLISRVKSFAAWQANWFSEGWRIWKVEEPFVDPGFKVESKSGLAMIRGRIDRIDYKPETGEYTIIDFKFGDSAASPSNAYSPKKGWIDVQLPCYYFYAQHSLGLENPRLALLPISAGSESLALSFAKWDSPTLDSAKEALQFAVDGILSQKFWPPKIKPAQTWDFESIYRAHL